MGYEMVLPWYNDCTICLYNFIYSFEYLVDGLKTYDRYVTTEDGANNSGPPKTGTKIGGQGKQQLCLGHAN